MRDDNIGRHDQKHLARECHREEMLVLGRPSCVNYRNWVFGVSKRWFDYKEKGYAPGRIAQSTKQLSVLAWFDRQRAVLDKMPDKPYYQIVAPFRKYVKQRTLATNLAYHSHIMLALSSLTTPTMSTLRDVYLWYKADQEAHPNIFPFVSASYFAKTWRDFADDIKLHKWLRFTKCDDCDRLRKVRWNNKLSYEERQQAQRDLHDHYKFVKAERALAESKKVRAMLQPTKYLSLALDGTDQLPNGLPQFRLVFLFLVWSMYSGFTRPFG